MQKVRLHQSETVLSFFLIITNSICMLPRYYKPLYNMVPSLHPDVNLIHSESMAVSRFIQLWSNQLGTIDPPHCFSFSQPLYHPNRPGIKVSKKNVATFLVTSPNGIPCIRPNRSACMELPIINPNRFWILFRKNPRNKISSDNAVRRKE